ncbi:predicted protein [Lichtheimia corymbifera JMRC:FSU:9682]|uniref:Uncharacterized protein n=1 Tax=Lichtheimia corymbifera JMRC:FSU:9682 TaxID=1263082 RepID=A0A068RVK5_9FUNG|nr:predicted protein [Lichtheimia corymbifera JMRC:FSU:9682]
MSRKNVICEAEERSIQPAPILVALMIANTSSKSCCCWYRLKFSPKHPKQQVALPTTENEPLARLFDKVESEIPPLSYICQYYGTTFCIAFRAPTIDTFVDDRH